MSIELIRKYNIPGPHYTSYPTAPFWKKNPILTSEWVLSRKNLLKPIIPILITMVGLFTILRGMNIGIPYISPKIQVETKKTHHNSCITKIDCCGKSSN